MLTSSVYFILTPGSAWWKFTLEGLKRPCELMYASSLSSSALGGGPWYLAELPGRRL